MAWYEGPCRITVVDVDADWPQRAVVAVSGSRGARIEIPGEAGTVRHIDAPSWHLEVEHLHEGKWRPNVRAIRSRWETMDGVRTQLVTSKDVDWPQGNQHERNLVLRLERIGEVDERAHEVGREAPQTGRHPVDVDHPGPPHGRRAGTLSHGVVLGRLRLRRPAHHRSGAHDLPRPDVDEQQQPLVRQGTGLPAVDACTGATRFRT